MEMIKRGRKERKKARDARWGLTAPFGVAWPLLRPLAAVVTSSRSFFDCFLLPGRANSCGPGVGGGRNEEPGDGNGGEERRAA
jgi:hypothetical protein